MVKEIDNIQDKVNWHWRNTMYPARFFGVDARAALPIPIILVYLRLSTFILLVGTMIMFRYLERKGLTFPAAVRNFRAWIVGKDRPGWISADKKKFINRY